MAIPAFKKIYSTGRGVRLEPTKGKSSPGKNSRRGCLCPHKDTYSVDCCNDNLQAQGIGNIYENNK